MDYLSNNLPACEKTLWNYLVGVVWEMIDVFRDFSRSTIRSIQICDGFEEGHSTLTGQQISYLDSQGRYLLMRNFSWFLAKFGKHKLVIVRNPIFLVSIENSVSGVYQLFIYVNAISLLPYKAEIYTPDDYFYIYWLFYSKNGALTYREFARGLCPSDDIAYEEASQNEEVEDDEPQ
jgi:hypothetical protein